MSDLTAIFGRSPVKPFQQHVDVVYRCALQLKPLFEAVIAKDAEAISSCRNDISLLEDEADDLKKHIRMNLPKSLFMPVRREDLLELLIVQDQIANRTKDISGLVVGRMMTIPEPVADDVLQYVQCNIDAATQARKSVRELDELFETGFRGAEVVLVQSLINELDRLESLSDRLQSSIRNRLFEIESDYPPIDMIFLYQVIGLIGDVGDMSERVGRRLELLLSS
jgi:predicted phosphate transport protein (TIGR00153 family)